MCFNNVKTMLLGIEKIVSASAASRCFRKFCDSVNAAAYNLFFPNRILNPIHLRTTHKSPKNLRASMYLNNPNQLK